MPPSDPQTTQLLEAIRDGLKRMEGSLVFSMQANGDLMRAQFQSSKKLEHGMKKMHEEQSQSNNLFTRSGLGANFNKGLTALGMSIMTLGSIFRSTMTQANELQKQALSRGQSLGSMMRENTHVTDALTKNIVGYQDALSINFDAFSKGLRSNNVALAKMGAMSKLTTGQNKQLFKAVAKNTEGLGFNDEAITKLSMSTMSLSQKFGITIEELQDSLKVLGQDLKVMGALGIGPQFVEAATRLSAALGPELASLGPSLLNSLTKGSAMVQASILGVASERQALLSGEGDMTRNSFALMMKASAKAEDLTTQWTRNSRDSTFMMSKMEGVYGSHMKELVQWRTGMKEAAKASGLGLDKYIESVIRQEKVNEEYRKTFAAFKSRVLSPFQKLFTWFSKILFKVMDLPGVDILVSVVVGVTAVIIGMGSIMTLLGSAVGKNSLMLAANTKAATIAAAQKTGSALSNLLYFLPWGRRGKMKLPGGHRNVKSGQFAKGPTGFFDKLKSVFGIGKTVSTKPGVTARGGMALTRAGGGSALKGLGAILKTVLGKLLWPLTILLALFAEWKSIKKSFDETKSRIEKIIKPVIVQLKGLWEETKKLFGGIDHLFSPLGKALAVVIDILMDLMVLTAMVGFKILEGIIWAVKKLVQGINWVFTKVINPLIDLVNKLVDLIGNIWNWIQDYFSFALPDWFSSDDDAGTSVSTGIDKYAVALEPYYDSDGKMGNDQLDELIGLNNEQKTMTELLQEQNELLGEIVAAGYNPGGVAEPTTPVGGRARPRGPRR